MKRSEWRRDVQKALIDRNMRMSRMARDFGVTPQWIYQVLNGKDETEAIKAWEQRISEYLGIEIKGELENEEE